ARPPVSPPPRGRSPPGLRQRRIGVSAVAAEAGRAGAVGVVVAAGGAREATTPTGSAVVAVAAVVAAAADVSARRRTSAVPTSKRPRSGHPRRLRPPCPPRLPLRRPPPSPKARASRSGRR